MDHKKIKSFLFLGLRFSLSFGILTYLLSKTDFQKLKELFGSINIFYYLLAFLCVLSFQTLVALRWKYICKAWKFTESLFFYLKTYLMGFSLNTVFPGIIAGDTLRSYFLTKRGLDWKKASFSVFLDRVLGFLGIMLILSFYLPKRGAFLPYKLKNFILLTVFLSLVFFFFISIFISYLKSNEFLNPLKLSQVLIPLTLGLIIQILFVFQFIALGKALDLKLDLELYFVIIPVISFLSALPISISGLGVREGTLSYFLHLLNYPIEYGISLGLLAYTLILFSALPGLLFYLKERGK